MKLRRRKLVAFAALFAAMSAFGVIFAAGAGGGGNHRGDGRGGKHETSVRWDIIRLTFPSPGLMAVNPGGSADAQTQAPAATFGPIETIRLTGSGTFAAPSRNHGRLGQDDVTGGGTWSVIGGASGTYSVTDLVDFEFANFQSPGLVDNIANVNERANGNAVLRIRYSDGQRGVLTIGCHGPGAPNHIFEGIAVTKGFKTYYMVQNPGADPNLNRTIFHVSRGDNGGDNDDNDDND